MSKSWSRDMKLSPGTFGGSPACHILVDMLNNNAVKVYDKHRILSFISTLTLECIAIATIKDAGYREKIMFRSRDFYLERINKEMTAYPVFVVNLIKNVTEYLCRKYLKEAARTIAG